MATALVDNDAGRCLKRGYQDPIDQTGKKVRTVLLIDPI
jgi:hypothetical protein